MDGFQRMPVASGVASPDNLASPHEERLGLKVHS